MKGSHQKSPAAQMTIKRGVVSNSLARPNYVLLIKVRRKHPRTLLRSRIRSTSRVTSTISQSRALQNLTNRIRQWIIRRLPHFRRLTRASFTQWATRLQRMDLMIPSQDSNSPRKWQLRMSKMKDQLWHRRKLRKSSKMVNCVPRKHKRQ